MSGPHATQSEGEYTEEVIRDKKHAVLVSLSMKVPTDEAQRQQAGDGPQPISSGIYGYKGYTIRTARQSGGKAGTGLNRTSTLQVTLGDGSGGYFIKKQFSFKVGDKAHYDKAWDKAVKWIDDTAQPATD